MFAHTVNPPRRNDEYLDLPEEAVPRECQKCIAREVFDELPNLVEPMGREAALELWWRGIIDKVGPRQFIERRRGEEPRYFEVPVAQAPHGV